MEKLYLERAENELELAKMISRISEDKTLQRETFNIDDPLSFYSAVITHSYYCIFYAAKAYLMSKGVRTKSPEEHRKTYEEFKKLVDEGSLDVELLMIYEEVLIKADSLLAVFSLERSKRGKFTYQTLSQANQKPAQESLSNASFFFRHVHNIL